MTDDFWYEGYGAGLSGLSWLLTVKGRFLAQHERRSLYNGWMTAQADKELWREDQRFANAIDDDAIPF